MRARSILLQMSFDTRSSFDIYFGVLNANAALGIYCDLSGSQCIIVYPVRKRGLIHVLRERERENGCFSNEYFNVLRGQTVPFGVFGR